MKILIFAKLAEALDHAERINSKTGKHVELNIRKHGIEVVVKSDAFLCSRLVSSDEIEYGVLNPIVSEIDRACGVVDLAINER